MELAAGVDEAGRGCLAGPVTAAAVVWDGSDEELRQHPDFRLVRDSKTLSRAQRARARVFIEDSAIAWGVAFSPADEVDSLNILHATFKAMHSALDQVSTLVPIEHVRVDGDRFKTYTDPAGYIIPHSCIVDGDKLDLSIAAASILAKTHRDEYVLDYMHASYPVYAWDRNLTYGTREHIDALLRHGPCVFHRRSFQPVKDLVTSFS